MNELAAQLLASTVVAALVSAIALVGREVVAARAGRRTARVQAQRDETRQRLEEHAMLLREVESLWRHNARLRRRESACQRRCRMLEKRLASVEKTCRELRRRLESLARAVTADRDSARTT